MTSDIPHTMRAAVCERYGGPEVLRMVELPRPVPRAGEVLVRVLATTVTSADSRVRALRVPSGLGWLVRLALGLRRPRRPVLGVECAGVVAAVGPGVTAFRVGDPVFGIDAIRMGCHAEYKCFGPRQALTHCPPGLSHEAAAALPFGGTTALHFLARARLQPGERVLVIGAGGAVGTAMVQLARHQGARVTAVCSEAHADLARALGAQDVIDRHRRDVLAGTDRFDVVIDLAGSVHYLQARRILAPKGRLLLLAPSLGDLLTVPWVGLLSNHRLIAGPATENPAQLHTLARLVQEGSYLPVVGHTLDFEQIALAHHLVDMGHKRGSLTLSLRPAG